ncbi:hypothetical protein Ilyop_2070 (plasmid) [Ilyobacter polytropus DSM 2926]|uniref:Uncharacterized protein n=1 Tax=Ilyobacter polytropus (strain ATCC 51220 / DSM 2926 / LMG 16218 / CuHBu1) TaxID=572544 RepID=E3HBS8_ILYPC|nr:hypothetical protein Ilyop_2070 [Ilyobacter polytropus DSM 2926]
MKKLILTLLLCISITVLAVPQASPWDSVTYAVKNYLKDNANDPKSIKYVECSYILKLSNGGWAQRVKFRGKNAYGGMVLNEYAFLISGDGNSAVVVSAGSMGEFSKALSSTGVSIVGSYNHEGKKVD